MIHPDDLSVALAARLHPAHQHLADTLAQVLTQVWEQRTSSANAASVVSPNPDLIDAVHQLARTHTRLTVDTHHVSFGEGSQMGDVTIGNVVGGDHIQLHFTLSEPPNTRGQSYRGLLFGGVVSVTCFVAGMAVLFWWTTVNDYSMAILVGLSVLGIGAPVLGFTLDRSSEVSSTSQSIVNLSGARAGENIDILVVAYDVKVNGEQMQAGKRIRVETRR